MITRRQIMKALALGPVIFDPELVSRVVLAQSDAGGAAARDKGVTVRQLMMQPLAGIDDKVAAVVTVEYAPGASSTPHRHPGHVFAYVLEGSVVSEVDPGTPITYERGQMWYEPPMHTHRVSRNASASKPAILLAFIILDKGQPITVGAHTTT